MILTTTSDSLTATWKPPVGSALNYTVERCLDRCVNETSVTTNIAFKNLKNAANYSVTVYAVSGQFTSTPVSAYKFTRESLLSSSVVRVVWLPPPMFTSRNISILILKSKSVNDCYATEKKDFHAELS